MMASMWAPSWLTLCNPMDYSLPGSSVHGIFQARILKCIAIPFSRKGDPSPGSPDPGIEPGSPALQADSLPPEPPEKQCRRPRFDPPPPGWEDPLERGMATHSNILAWRIPWIEEPGRLQSMGSQRVGHD